MESLRLDNTKLKDVLASVKAGVGTQRIVLMGVTILFAMSIVSNVRLSSKIISLSESRPVYVVPGAVEGVYAPGLTKYNTTNAVRYLVSLATNLTPSNAKARLDELERFCAPEFLSEFQKEKSRLLKEIQAQNQSRAVQPDKGDALKANDDHTYSYTMTGAWDIMSGGILMSNDKHTFTLDFRIGSASSENPYGIVFYSLKFIQLAGRNERQSTINKGPV